MFTLWRMPALRAGDFLGGGVGEEETGRHGEACAPELSQAVSSSGIQRLEAGSLTPLDKALCILIPQRLHVCVSSFLPPLCSQVDRIVALSRLRQSGAFLTTSEGLILQLVRDAAHPRFREVIICSFVFNLTFLLKKDPKGITSLKDNI